MRGGYTEACEAPAETRGAVGSRPLRGGGGAAPRKMGARIAAHLPRIVLVGEELAALRQLESEALAVHVRQHDGHHGAVRNFLEHIPVVAEGVAHEDVVVPGEEGENGGVREGWGGRGGEAHPSKASAHERGERTQAMRANPSEASALERSGRKRNEGAR